MILLIIYLFIESLIDGNHILIQHTLNIMKKQITNPDKILGLNPIEKDYRFGDTFTRIIRRAHMRIQSNGMTITYGNYLCRDNVLTFKLGNDTYYADKNEIKRRNKFMADRDNQALNHTLFSEMYGLKGWIKDIPYLLPSNPVHGKSSFAGNINSLKQIAKTISKIDADKWDLLKKEVRPDTFDEDVSLLSKLYNPQLVQEMVAYNPHLDTIPAMKLYKEIILKELNSKSIDIKFRFESDEPFIRISNNNIDLTINDSDIINKFKLLLIKAMQ